MTDGERLALVRAKCEAIITKWGPLTSEWESDYAQGMEAAARDILSVLDSLHA